MRNSTKEYLQFLYIALGSLGELDTQVELAFRLGYVKNVDVIGKDIKILRMQLFGLLKSLKNKL